MRTALVNYFECRAQPQKLPGPMKSSPSATMLSIPRQEMLSLQELRETSLKEVKEDWGMRGLRLGMNAGRRSAALQGDKKILAVDREARTPPAAACRSSALGISRNRRHAQYTDPTLQARAAARAWSRSCPPPSAPSAPARRSKSNVSLGDRHQAESPKNAPPSP